MYTEFLWDLIAAHVAIVQEIMVPLLSLTPMFNQEGKCSQWEWWETSVDQHVP